MKTKRREQCALDALIVLALMEPPPTADELAMIDRYLIQEHDLVRIRVHTIAEGVAITAGAIGTVVNVYRNGEAFAVEFPGASIGKANPFVVTLPRDSVDLIRGT